CKGGGGGDGQVRRVAVEVGDRRRVLIRGPWQRGAGGDDRAAQRARLARWNGRRGVGVRRKSETIVARRAAPGNVLRLFELLVGEERRGGKLVAALDRRTRVRNHRQERRERDDDDHRCEEHLGKGEARVLSGAPDLGGDVCLCKHVRNVMQRRCPTPNFGGTTGTMSLYSDRSSAYWLVPDRPSDRKRDPAAELSRR